MWRGKKVLLRAIERRDVETFRQMLNDPDISQHLLVFTPLSEIAEERWFERTTQSTTELVMAIESNDLGRPRQLIGNCGFHGINWKDRTATLGIFIGNQSFWSNGYGTEAASRFNERSLGLHKKLGFQNEGARRQNIFKNGAYHDEILLGLLREEWEKVRV